MQTLAGASYNADLKAQFMTKSARDITEDLFNHVRAKTNWPIDTGECLWGYFFYDPDRIRLEAASRLLEAQGYRLVAIFDNEPDPEKPDDVRSEPTMRWLHVEKVEQHSVDTLMAREERLREFARQNGLSYDGMEVGAVVTDQSPC